MKKQLFNADEITLDNFEGIKKYRKEPIVIHAIQLNFPFEVTTKEGKLRGKAGDFLIWGIKGEKYPCDSEIFNETYREVR